ncbi:MAG: hypothetical protein A2Z50_02140 [Nitrospirae bacterium RBG_19FT_COMBO_42_15]|nr:MAG: hypothetical protein A2Z50_02140 [Nitrospirae bacterium RBG_19FT_COMBO_42_15]
MKNRILTDTSVWIEFFKLKSKIGDRLEYLLIENSIWTCGIIMFELLQGVKSEPEKVKILDKLSSLPYVEMTDILWQKSAELSISLKKEGLNLPLSDIFISAIAIENNLSVFTIDKHFEQMPNLKLYRI